MSYDESTDIASTDPAQRAEALIERAIAAIESGDQDSALADLQKAEAAASDAGIPALVTAVRINRGYAHSVSGDADSAIACYSEAAESARDSGDGMRLQLALANLSAELDGQGRHDEARDALDEYLQLLDDTQVTERVRALTTRGLSRLESGDTTAAFSDLEAADEAATEANDVSLLYHTKMNLGHAYKRNEDPQSALMLYDRACLIARQLEDTDALRDALMSLAQTGHSVGQNHLARHQFIELEGLCRRADDPAYLAHMLYWYGSNLQSLGRTQDAIAKWDEAASIRRDLGHEGHLADCLLMMADAQRRRGQHQQADPLYTEAEEIYSRLGVESVLGSTMYWHGMSLWSGGRPEEAMERANEALRVANEQGDDEYECRSHGLRAMILADLDDLAGANEELDIAETRCTEAGLRNLVVWMLARRAYLYAREGRPVEEVKQELSRAFIYAADNDEMNAATSAIRRVTSLISSRCAEEYREPVKDLKEQLLAGPVDPITGDGMPDLPFPPAGEESEPQADFSSPQEQKSENGTAQDE
jgi:tetratricopeptide (TPR) repeat protein